MWCDRGCSAADPEPSSYSDVHLHFIPKNVTEFLPFFTKIFPILAPTSGDRKCIRNGKYFPHFLYQFFPRFGAEWAELIFHRPPQISEGQGGACARRHICSRTQDNRTVSEIHWRIRVLQCAHALSETVHNAHDYNLLSPWLRHPEVLLFGRPVRRVTR